MTCVFSNELVVECLSFNSSLLIQTRLASGVSMGVVVRQPVITADFDFSKVNVAVFLFGHVFVVG